MTQPFCGICHNQAGTTRHLYCPTCAIQSSLGLRIRLINSQTEVAELTAKIDEIIGPEYTYNKIVNHTESKDSSILFSSSNGHYKYTEPLDVKVKNLRAHTDRLRKALSNIRKKTATIQSDTQWLLAQNRQKRQKITESKDSVYKHYDTCYQQMSKSTTLSLTKTNEETLVSIDTLRDKFTHDLVILFGVRRRRRRKGRVSASSKSSSSTTSPEEALQPASPDLVMSFSVLPDLSFLPSYSHPSINASLERMAYFVVLLGYYLDVRLIFEISLPSRHQSRPRISRFSRSAKHELFLSSGVQFLALQKPKEFEDIIEGLAMLALNLNSLASHLGIERKSFKQIAQINTVIALIYDKLAPEENLLKGVNVDYNSENDEVDLTSLTNYIITQAYFEINGASGEWNIVDKVMSDIEGDE